jgi:allantoinase
MTNQQSLQPPIPYRAAPDAPALAWPNGARVAVWIIPNIEWFPLGQPVPRGRAGAVPDVPAWSVREYGNRVGVWRLMDVLDRAGARATVALNSEVCDVYPAIIEAGQKRGWEWMGHGVTNAQLLSGLDEEDERTVITRTMQRIGSTTGSRPKGWLGPGLQETFLTLAILAEAGVEYVADWVVDDRPFPLRAGARTLVGLPYSLEVNDIPCYERWNLTPEEYGNLICRTFDVLYREGEQTATVMAIPLHPYLSGYPARSAALHDALQYIKARDQVWWATGSEIAASYRAQDPIFKA